MNQKNQQSLETAILEAASDELTIMKSISRLDVVSDVQPVVAMRLSRALIARLCRFRHLQSEGSDILDDSSIQQLIEIEKAIENLNLQFGNRLLATANNKILLAVWNA